MRIAFVAIAGLVLMQACNRKNDYQAVLHNPLLFSHTVYELNGVVMGNNFSPIVASRNYLYASIAAYEVMAAGYPGQIPVIGRPGPWLEAIAKPAPDKAIDFEFAAHCLPIANLAKRLHFLQAV